MVKSNFSYEDIYAMRIMAFEKNMAKMRRRPPLPVRHTGSKEYENKAPAAVAQREEQMKTRRAVYKDVLENVAAGEAIDVRTLSERISMNSKKLANYVRLMVDDGYLNKLSMAKGKIMYIYMKTGKELTDE